MLDDCRRSGREAERQPRRLLRREPRQVPRRRRLVRADQARRFRAIGERGLLKGVLVTPNTLAAVEEYDELCEYARTCGAEYVLMNPLSSMGRGCAGSAGSARASRSCGRSAERTAVRGRPRDGADPLSQRRPAAVGLRGRDDPLRLRERRGDRLPVSGVRRAHAPVTPQTRQSSSSATLRARGHRGAARSTTALHDRSRSRRDPVCGSCAICGWLRPRCPAAVIAAGGRLGERDREQCHVPEPAERGSVTIFTDHRAPACW